MDLKILSFIITAIIAMGSGLLLASEELPHAELITTYTDVWSGANSEGNLLIAASKEYKIKADDSEEYGLIIQTILKDYNRIPPKDNYEDPYHAALSINSLNSTCFDETSRLEITFADGKQTKYFVSKRTLVTPTWDDRSYRCGLGILVYIDDVRQFSLADITAMKLILSHYDMDSQTTIMFQKYITPEISNVIQKALWEIYWYYEGKMVFLER